MPEMGVSHTACKVSTKSLISQLECILILYNNINPFLGPRKSDQNNETIVLSTVHTLDRSRSR